MKYLRKFNTEADYNAFKDSDTYVTPNVVLVNGAVDYNPVPPSPLYVEALQSIVIRFGNNYEYSKDNVTWTSGTSSTSISAKKGEKVYLRASGLTATSSQGIGSLSVSKTPQNTGGKFNIGGNIMSMVYGADFDGKIEITQPYQFYRFFGSATYNYDGLVDASKLILPATTLTPHCYEKMFRYHKGLVAAPALPATTLAPYCYSDMFEECTVLTTAPALPVTTLASYCYSSMFYNCTSLTTAPALPATTLIDRCYNSMFYNCTSLAAAPALPATTLARYCYNNMFKGCTSLTTAPALPATTLAGYCYQGMFSGCTSLTTAPALPATTMDWGCYWDMFYNCTSLTTAPALPATTLIDRCYDSMFYNCTSLTTAPALPATKLSAYCYDGMFEGCNSLNYIKTMQTTEPSSTFTSNWVSGVSTTGTFVKNSAATWADTFGTSAIPEGWTVELADA